MSKHHLLTEYCSGIGDLSSFLENIHPDDIISITQKYGYTVVYKSNSPYSWKYSKHKKG